MTANFLKLKDTNMNIKPLGDRVLVKPIEEEEIKGGIVLPDTAEKEKKQQGEVIAIGAGEKVNKLELAIGKKVLYGKFSGDEIEIDNQDYKFLNHDDILAVIE